MLWKRLRIAQTQQLLDAPVTTSTTTRTMAQNAGAFAPVRRPVLCRAARGLVTIPFGGDGWHHHSRALFLVQPAQTFAFQKRLDGFEASTHGGKDGAFCIFCMQKMMQWHTYCRRNTI
mmetsp:Transcript_66513/g.145821  ORF Transcript_66513/g.145821 Transcript_66513/m.145821 type:complete len:118 (-) Transcript_66513:135-488(-)